jgi:hypothetical protein
MTLVEVITAIAMLSVLIALVASLQSLLGSADRRQKSGLAFDAFEIEHRLDFDLVERFNEKLSATGDSLLERCLANACEPSCDEAREARPLRWGRVPVRLVNVRRESGAADWENRGGAYRTDEALTECQPLSRPTQDGPPPRYQNLLFEKGCDIRAAVSWRLGGGGTIEILLDFELQSPNASPVKRTILYRKVRLNASCIEGTQWEG